MRLKRILLAAILFWTANTASQASDWEEEADQPKAANASPKDKKTESTPTIIQNKNGRMFLQGKVEHSNTVAPLADNLQAGASFNPQNMRIAKYASNWFKIPAWFAGTFESQGTTILTMREYATGKTSKPNHTVQSHGQELHGYQRDANGGIWHYYVESGSSRSTQAQHETLSTIDWYGPELISNDRIVIRIMATSLVVDRATGTIIDSFRREDIKTYEPFEMRALKVSYTSKSFDSHGRPRDLQTGYSIYRMMQPFRSIDQDGETNYRTMFKDYLNTHNLATLIPPELR